ncbi:alpha-E domain-containing protein [Curtobacterium sp. MCBA15_004]|uniref:alpha-E domain-containing protein n=1 Tax=unclassified Curtobacterium TaxID=257496 RepID=UPI0008DDAB8E|nr:alpha-E domain-containing protein [Curtobacterium sp. MCBA15_004]WIA97485.1 alpha-E domain-containing protein [Curtobacterium sp. MCBA15_004]
MLNRLAGSVFHVGSAVERADVVARMLDVYVVRADLGADGVASTAALRSVLGAEGRQRDPGAAATVDALALDRHEPASIAHAVGVARDHARRAREVVATELWDCLDATRSRMPRKVALDRSHEFLGWVRERSALAVGVVEGDASRDEVWEFFTLGRSLLRCAVTARLLASELVHTGPGGPPAPDRPEPVSTSGRAGASAGAAPDDPAPTTHQDRAPSAHAWTTALRACGAVEAFRRGHGHRPPRPADVASFLLHDATSPRSLAFLAQRAEDCLDDVAPACLADEVDGFRRARAALGRIDVGGPEDALRAAVARLAASVDAVVDALGARVFAPAPVR